jgi:hypothetical protein
MTAATINTGGTIFNRLSQCIAYADDVVIIGRNIDTLKQTFVEVTKEATKLGFVVNMEKTTYMISPQKKEKWNRV